jgi:hypothetical protein
MGISRVIIGDSLMDFKCSSLELFITGAKPLLAIDGLLALMLLIGTMTLRRRNMAMFTDQFPGRPVRIVTHEQIGRVLAGATVLGAVALAQFVSPWFLLAAVGTGLNLVLSGLTQRCAVKRLLIRMGVPGERDLGRAEAMASDAKREPAVFRRTTRPLKVPVNN